MLLGAYKAKTSFPHPTRVTGAVHKAASKAASAAAAAVEGEDMGEDMGDIDSSDGQQEGGTDADGPAVRVAVPQPFVGLFRHEKADEGSDGGIDIDLDRGHQFMRQDELVAAAGTLVKLSGYNFSRFILGSAGVVLDSQLRVISAPLRLSVPQVMPACLSANTCAACGWCAIRHRCDRFSAKQRSHWMRRTGKSCGTNPM